MILVFSDPILPSLTIVSLCQALRYYSGNQRIKTSKAKIRGARLGKGGGGGGKNGRDKLMTTLLGDDVNCHN